MTRSSRLALAVAAVAAALLTIAGPAAAQVSFSAPQSYPVGDRPVDVKTADFDQDGDLDLAVSNYNSYDVSVLLGQDDGTFGAATAYSVSPGVPTEAAIGNFDEDTDPDLVVVNADPSQQNDLAVLLGAPGGTFGAPTDFQGDSPDDRFYDRQVSVAIGDFNEDGDPDLATVSGNFHTLAILLGQPGGGFAPPADIYIGQSRSVRVGDFDQDGHVDLAATSGNNSVRILLGRGDATFEAPVEYPLEDLPLDLAIGDFNGDGYDDLAAPLAYTGVAVLLGGPDGTLGAAVKYPSGGAFPSGVAIGDFDRDGSEDLVVTNINSHNVSVLLGGGDGTFGAPLTFASGGISPDSVAVGDFDGDGNPDLAVTNQGNSDIPLPGNVSVLFNETAPPAPECSDSADNDEDGATDGQDGGCESASDDSESPDPAISVSDVSVSEGDAGTGNASFTLSLDRPSGRSITVEFATADGSAAAPGDYESTSGTATFAAGSTSVTVDVPVNGDTTDEPDETFELRLSNPTAASVADATGVGTIADDDEPPPSGGTSPPPVGGGSPPVNETRDGSPPDTTITDGPSSPTRDSTPSFSFEASERGASFECAMNGGAWSKCSSPHGAARFRIAVFAAARLGDGEHTFRVRAIDGAGNVDPTPADRTFVVDTRSPQIALRGLGRDVCRGRSVRARVRVAEANGLRRVRVYLNGRRIRETRRGRFSVRMRPGRRSSAGARLLVLATDEAGNTGRRSVRVCRVTPRFTG